MESGIESAKLQPINLGTPMLKELGAKWMVEMAAYLSENPQIVVNGFVKGGIAEALDSHTDCRPEEENVREGESDSEEYDRDADGNSSFMDLTGQDD